VPDGMNVPTQLAEPSDENSTELVPNARRRRSPIGTVHNDIAARLRAHMVPCGLPGEPPCLWCAAADEIERLRDKVQDLRMHAQQDATEMERLFTKGNELREQIATLIEQRDHAQSVSLMWEQHARNQTS